MKAANPFQYTGRENDGTGLDYYRVRYYHPVLQGMAKGIEKAFERQLAKQGVKSLEKSLRSLERRLAEHLQKLADIRAAGGHTSSVEREISTFQKQIDAIKRILGRQS